MRVDMVVAIMFNMAHVETVATPILGPSIRQARLLGCLFRIEVSTPLEAKFTPLESCI